jgi:hypothetical protein
VNGKMVQPTVVQESYWSNGNIMIRRFSDWSYENYTNDGTLWRKVDKCGQYEVMYPSGKIKEKTYYSFGDQFHGIVVRKRFYESGSVELVEYKDGVIEHFDNVLGIQQRCKLIKEELMAEAFHPKNIQKWLDVGGWKLFDMMAGSD